MDLNLNLRSEILEYSLILENAINDLLLLNLGIYDGGEKTRLFGNKAGVSFKNKIDLLNDINVLNKVENSELELLMNFRNKFLHDINCSTFLSVIELLDNGIKNRFKVFLKEGESLSDESACRTACSNLFLKNISTIKNKVKQNRIKLEDRIKLFQLQNNQIAKFIDIIYDLVNDLCLILEKSELEDEKVRKLSEQINEKLENVLQQLNSNNKIKNEIDDFLRSAEKMKNFFGIVKSSQISIPNWNDFKNS
jgi:uncharacterized protein YutE (UPF0331/DUF86 family)